MKKTIAMLLCLTVLLMPSACSSKQSGGQKTDPQAELPTTSETQDGSMTETEEVISNLTEQKPETSPESVAEQSQQPREEQPMNDKQFYITANDTTFVADFADHDSAYALRELLRKGDVTIRMSDYGSFEKVGSIGTSLPRKDKEITTTTGDVVLYQGDKIVIFYGTNQWSYSRLGKVEGATAEALLFAFGSGDVTVTFSLTPQHSASDEKR